MQDEQISIYDFLPAGESQEVAPSETLPQVDEAQEYGSTLGLVYRNYSPSSALDTKESTEDTDKTLFSVGDVLTVRKASDVYNANIDPEDFYFLKEYEEEQVKLLNIRGKSLLCNTFNLDKDIWLRAHELQKI